PPPLQAQNVAGGVYQVQRRAGAASFIEVPTAAPGLFTPGDVLNAQARRTASGPRLRLRASCRRGRLRASIGGADRKLVKRVDYRLGGRRAGASTKLPFARTIRTGARRPRLTAVAKLRDGRRATLTQRVRCSA